MYFVGLYCYNKRQGVYWYVYPQQWIDGLVLFMVLGLLATQLFEFNVYPFLLVYIL